MCVRLDEAANQLLATTLVGKLIGFGMDAKGESERFARPEAGLSIIVATFSPLCLRHKPTRDKKFLELGLARSRRAAADCACVCANKWLLINASLLRGARRGRQCSRLVATL